MFSNVLFNFKLECCIVDFFENYHFNAVMRSVHLTSYQQCPSLPTFPYHYCGGKYNTIAPSSAIYQKYLPIFK